MESKTRVLGVIQMRDTTGEVHRLTVRTKQLVSAKIFDGKPEMVQHLLFETLTSKIQPRLREQGVDSPDSIRRALRVVQQGKQS